MEQTKPTQGVPNHGEPTPPSKSPWENPKLAFVEPEISKQGGLTEITGQFLGGFSPDGN